MPRKGENIRKRKDGRWEARYSLANENGDKRYLSVYATSYLEVKKKRLEAIKNATKSADATSFHLRELASEWLDNVKFSIKEASYTRYHRNIYRYILPYFESKNLTNINVQSINAFKKDLSDGCEVTTKPLSSKTISDIMSVFKLFLIFCEKDGYVCPDFTKTITIKQKSKNHVLLSQEQRVIIEEALWNGNSEVELGILLALYTGIRIGELCALKWEDINFEDSIISIDKTLERISDLDADALNKTKIIIDSAKTISSKRKIPIPQSLLSRLEKFRHNPNCYVITGKETPTEPHNFYMRYKKLMKKLEINDISFHALRHIFATQCVELGFDTKALSEILGHSNVTTTLKCYVHPTMKAKKDQMDKLCPEVFCGQKLG